MNTQKLMKQKIPINKLEFKTWAKQESTLQKQWK